MTVKITVKSSFSSVLESNECAGLSHIIGKIFLPKSVLIELCRTCRHANQSISSNQIERERKKKNTM